MSKTVYIDAEVSVKIEIKNKAVAELVKSLIGDSAIETEAEAFRLFAQEHISAGVTDASRITGWGALKTGDVTMVIDAVDMPQAEVDWAMIGKAIMHPKTAKVLAILAKSDEPRSPNEISKELDEGVGNVSYHVRKLLDEDRWPEGALIELVKTEPRRGAVEHFYKAKTTMFTKGIEKR